MPDVNTATADATASSEESESVATDSAAAESSESSASPAEQQAADMGAAPEEAPAEEAKPPKPSKYKLGDKEWDEKDLLEALDVFSKRKEHTAAANKKFAEAAAERKAAEERAAWLKQQIDSVEKDPWAVHRAKGMTEEQINKLAYGHLQEQARRAELQQQDPQRFQAEQEYRELQGQLEAARQEKAQHEAWAAEQQATAQRQQHEQFIEAHLPAAVEKMGMKGIPEAGYLTQTFVVAQLQAGGEVDFDSAAESAKDFLQQAAKSYLANLPRETLEQEFPDLVKSLREASIARVPKVPTVKPVAPGAPKQKQPAADEPFDRDEFFRRLKRGEVDFSQFPR